MIIISKKKFEEIKNEIESLKKKINLPDDFTLDLVQIQNDLNETRNKFELIYNQMFGEPSEEQLKQQEEMMKEELENMKGLVQNAIIEMVNKPENQKAIQDFVSAMAGAVKGNVEGLPFDLATVLGADGEVDLLKAAVMWWQNRPKGSTGTTPARLVSSGKTGVG